MLKWSIRIISIILVFVCGAWVKNSPTFESIVGLLSAIGGLLLSFVMDKKSSNIHQEQHVQNSSIAIQAGRDAKATIEK